MSDSAASTSSSSTSSSSSIADANANATAAVNAPVSSSVSVSVSFDMQHADRELNNQISMIKMNPFYFLEIMKAPLQYFNDRHIQYDAFIHQHHHHHHPQQQHQQQQQQQARIILVPLTAEYEYFVTRSLPSLVKHLMACDLASHEDQVLEQNKYSKDAESDDDIKAKVRLQCNELLDLLKSLIKICIAEMRYDHLHVLSYMHILSILMYRNNLGTISTFYDYWQSEIDKNWYSMAGNRWNSNKSNSPYNNTSNSNNRQRNNKGFGYHAKDSHHEFRSASNASPSSCSPTSRSRHRTRGGDRSAHKDSSQRNSTQSTSKTSTESIRESDDALKHMMTGAKRSQLTPPTTLPTLKSQSKPRPIDVDDDKNTVTVLSEPDTVLGMYGL
jgi:hypothetical protein